MDHYFTNIAKHLIDCSSGAAAVDEMLSNISEIIKAFGRGNGGWMFF